MEGFCLWSLILQSQHGTRKDWIQRREIHFPFSILHNQNSLRRAKGCMSGRSIAKNYWPRCFQKGCRRDISMWPTISQHSNPPNPVIHEGCFPSPFSGGQVVDTEALISQQIFCKISARYHWCTEYANISRYRRFFIPMKGEQLWSIPQSKHNDCNPNGRWGYNSIILRSSTVSCRKHSIKTRMWCHIDTCILQNVDPHRNIFQETICSRPILKMTGCHFL